MLVIKSHDLTCSHMCKSCASENVQDVQKADPAVEDSSFSLFLNLLLGLCVWASQAVACASYTCAHPRSPKGGPHCADGMDQNQSNLLGGQHVVMWIVKDSQAYLMNGSVQFLGQVIGTAGPLTFCMGQMCMSIRECYVACVVV